MGGENPSSGGFRIYQHRYPHWDRFMREFAEFVLRDLGLVAVDPKLVETVRIARDEFAASENGTIRKADHSMRLANATDRLADAVLSAMEETNER